MADTRDIRRCALQALYQIDVADGDLDDDALTATLIDSPGGKPAHRRGVEIARLAWSHHDAADQIIAELTPDWPIHRQPVIDRCLLRLAYWEMIAGDTPPKVAINEAIELAREFSTEKSPMFINGVLDKIYRRHRDAATQETSA